MTEKEMRKKSFRILSGRQLYGANKLSETTLMSPLGSKNQKLFDRTRSGTDLAYTLY